MFQLNGILVGAVVGSLIGLILVMSNKGSRFKKLIRFSGDFEKMNKLINDFLISKGYCIENYGNEVVYRKGSRLLIGRKFIKISSESEGILVEAFVNLSGKNESGIDGFVGAASKKQLKGVVDKVIAMIEVDGKSL